MVYIREISGILLSISFAIAYLPQIFRIVRNRSSEDVSLGMLILNLIGYISGMVYITSNEIAKFWVVMNYGMGIGMTILTGIVWYKFRKRV